jgi:hypothetical protein
LIVTQLQALNIRRGEQVVQSGIGQAAGRPHLVSETFL